MQSYLLEILFIILSFQLLFVSFFLFQSKRGKKLSNRILAVIFLMLSIAVIEMYRMMFGYASDIPQLMYVDDPFLLAYGPLLFLFTQSVLIKDYKAKARTWLNFLPFLFLTGYIILIILSTDTETMAEVAKKIENNEVPLYVRFIEIVLLWHIITYIFLSKYQIRKVVKEAHNTYSSLNKENIKRLQFILNFFMALIFVSMINSTLPFMGVKNGLLITLILLILFIFYFVNYVLLKMLKQSAADSGLISQSGTEQAEKYSGSGLKEGLLLEYKEKLSGLMSEKRAYLNSDLTISRLSEEMDLSPKKLSQVINEGFSCNFFDFVNQYRLEEAKKMFLNQTDDKMTILEVMYATGFNSKSSFNVAFKKFTGLTPSQFRIKHKKGSTS